MVGRPFTPEEFTEAREARWENIDFWLANGYSVPWILQKLDTSASSLARQAYRHGWPDRAKVFNPESRRERYQKKQRRAS